MPTSDEWRLTAFVYSPHARDMLAERGIDPRWVEHAVLSPELVEPDPKHPGRKRAFRTVPERDGRVLRVVDERRDGDVRVITLFLNRGSEAALMKTRYDPETDAFSMRFADAAVVESEEVRPGVIFDFDQEGRIIAIEVLGASEHLSAGFKPPDQAAA